MGEMLREPREDARLCEEVFGGEFLAEGGEDLPEGHAAGFGEACLEAKAGYLAVGFPGAKLPRIDHLFPLGAEKIRSELGGKSSGHLLQAGVHFGIGEDF